MVWWGGGKCGGAPRALMTRPAAILSTPLNPCTLERLEGTRQLAVGTYHLDATSGVKTGAVGVVSAHASPPLLAAVLPSVPGAAVFDGHWQPHAVRAAAPLFLTAAHGGRLDVYALARDSGALAPVPGASLALSGDAATLSCLGCDWVEEPVAGQPARVVASFSDGRVWCGAVGGGRGCDDGVAWAAHSLGGGPIEVWVATACPASRSVVWTGGDDAALRGWDVRDGAARPTFTSRAHTAGVTSVAWSPRAAHVVATGSYDERLLLWDDRLVGAGGGSSRAAPLADTPMGGGVWRLKWAPVGPPPPEPAREGGGVGLAAQGRADAHRGEGPWSSALAAACMYGGVRVVDAGAIVGSGGGGNDVAGAAAAEGEGAPLAAGVGCGAPLALPTLAHYAGHGAGSIAYGIEWVSWGSTERPLFASCAFYEREVHLWEP